MNQQCEAQAGHAFRARFCQGCAHGLTAHGVGGREGVRPSMQGPVPGPPWSAVGSSRSLTWKASVPSPINGEGRTALSSAGARFSVDGPRMVRGGPGAEHPLGDVNYDDARPLASEAGSWVGEHSQRWDHLSGHLCVLSDNTGTGSPPWLTAFSQMAVVGLRHKCRPQGCSVPFGDTWDGKTGEYMVLGRLQGPLCPPALQNSVSHRMSSQASPALQSSPPMPSMLL